MPKFTCDCCGACCRGHLIVETDALDLMREPHLLTADPHYAAKSFDQVMIELEEPGRAVIIACGRPCPFLGQDNRCSIYPTRPNDCVAMQAGDE